MAGAETPVQDTAEKPAIPASAIAGISLSIVLRSLLVTAMALSFPSFACASALVMLDPRLDGIGRREVKMDLHGEMRRHLEALLFGQRHDAQERRDAASLRGGQIMPEHHA